VSALVLDAGAFVAVDRGDRAVAARLRVAQRSDIDLRSNGAVVAQVWRDPTGRQAELARLLRAVDIESVDEEMGRRAGTLLARTATNDAIDATVVAMATAGDRILSSDPKGIRALVVASKLPILVVPC
jgi:hypothetical protein